MADLNWGLLQQGQGGNALVSGIEAGTQAKMQDRKLASEDRLLAGQEKVSNALAKGDYDGARQGALASGNPELMSAVSQMSKAKRDDIDRKMTKFGTVAFGISNLPQEQWGAAFEAAKPTLKQAGFTDDELSQVQLNPQALQASINGAISLKDAIAQANSQRDYALKQDEFGEKKTMDAATIGHQKAMEGTAQASARAAMINATSGNKQWQVLSDPKTNTQYRYNPVTGKSTTLDGTAPYSPSGAAKITSGQARSAASLAAQRYVQEHPNATAEDVAQFAADYGKTVKSVGAFSTGKQGDLVRSFNVAVSHLNTLGSLVGALGNGDVQGVNRLSNAIAQQTGKPAPTNFDAAKAIVGDEIIKAIVGGGGALADRENAQNQISRANSTEQLLGVISTYKDLMAGQLKGLKKQYSDTTGRADFDKRLSPEAAKELEGISPKLGSPRAPVPIKDDAGYNRLPSGTHFIGPDGKMRVKP